MGYLAVEKLEHGMVLDEDVHDINTRLLLSRGQKLAHNHIRILKIWGISGVSIVGSRKENGTGMSGMDDANIDRIKTAINLVFKNVDLTNPALKEIYKQSLIHRLKSGASDSLRPDRPACDANAPLNDLEPISGQIEKIDSKLPDAPTIISKLNQVICNPLATSNDVAQVVNTSPSLAATLLKIVNSAYYGFPSRIDRITRAVTIIGTKEISSLALGICVMQTFSDIPKKIITMQAFISHSLACGIISRILAAMGNIAQTEQLFISGLLHDIGKLIVYKYYPDHAVACSQKAESSGISVLQTEKQIIGMKHPQIAKILMKKWKLPVELIDSIAFHHCPGRSQNPEKAGIVHLADIITHGIDIGSSGERTIPAIDYAVIGRIMQSNPNMKMVIRQAVHQLGPLEAIFRSQLK